MKKKSHSRYFTDSLKVRLLLSLYDGLTFFRKKPKPIESNNIQKILVCNWATLGDVILSTSILPWLKQKWPDAKIDFLTSPNSQVALENHPLINKVYTALNWKVDALKSSILSQIRLLLQSLTSKYSSLISHLKKENYDLAIDLHPFFPNTSCILKSLNIPHIVTFDSAGFHPLHAHVVSFPKTLRYLPHMYAHLLHSIGIEASYLKPCFYFKKSPQIPKEFIIFHVGTTEKAREWNISYWKSLAKKLSSEGFKIVFTGQGKREQEAILDISSHVPDALNLCNLLDWSDFLSFIQEAQMVISVNTVTIHLAAALKTPILGLFLATKYLELWLPEETHCHFLIQDSDCAYLSDPSFLKNHPKVDVVLKITPEKVYSSFKRFYLGKIGAG